MVWDLAGDENSTGAWASPPMNGVTTYPVTINPASSIGAAHDNDACRSPATASPMVGGASATQPANVAAPIAMAINAHRRLPRTPRIRAPNPPPTMLGLSVAQTGSHTPTDN